MFTQPNYTVRLWIIIFFTTLSIVSIAQKKESNFSAHSMFKINTLSLLDPLTPTLQVGFERKFNGRWAAEGTIGIPLNLFYNLNNHDSFYYHYYKIKVQVKHYFKDSDNYLAFEAARTTVNYNAFHDGYVFNRVTYAFQSADFTKQIYGFVLKFGRLCSVSQRWRIEPAAGYGVRMVQTSVESANAISGNYHTERWGGPTRIGWKVTPHLIYEAKVVYVL